jgi:hypothetical protein
MAKKRKGARLHFSISEGAKGTWLQSRRMEEGEDRVSASCDWVLHNFLFLFGALVVDLASCWGVGELSFVVEVGWKRGTYDVPSKPRLFFEIIC